MKLKNRIQVILGICLFLVIILIVYFNRFEVELQKGPPKFFIKRNVGSLLYFDIRESQGKFIPGGETTGLDGMPLTGDPGQGGAGAALGQGQFLQSGGSSTPKISFGGIEKKHKFHVAALVGLQINAKLGEMNFSANPYYKRIVARAKIEFQNDEFKDDVNVWEYTRNLVSSSEIHSRLEPHLGRILTAMKETPIVKVEVAPKGSQLKALVTLDGNQKALFKPMRYPRDHIIFESPYAGADRHNGEIAAFHLNRLLGFRRVPLTVGRVVNVRDELQSVSSPDFLKTFLRDQKEEDRLCFYGVCFYCRPSEMVCGNQNDEIEGALILWLPTPTPTPAPASAIVGVAGPNPQQAPQPQQHSLKHFNVKKMKSPFRRTYRKNTTARWENESNYCEERVLIKSSPFAKYESLFLDLLDVAIFDYLIGNADRHTLEVATDPENPRIMLIDNGKSFGNPYWDELTILAPLYQCCKIRKSTHDHLTLLIDSLSSALEEVMTFDPLTPLLTRPHLDALDRRLRIVMTVIQLCIDRDNYSRVIVF